MEHHRIYNNPPLHWGYSTPSPHTIHNTWVPPPSRGIKRSISESDCDDNYSETSSKETSPKENDADSCQHLSRKKRRGVIEKKRRDRINSSLSELKRLVPSAFEKQGSSKLEKAEILQLTVDHLKTLHSKGMDSMAFDPQRYAMDYHVIGFQECVSEVARYLITHEGMDIQNPLRMRLLSHLRCFATQRELTSKASTAPSTNQNWTPATPHPSGYQPSLHPQTNYASPSALGPPIVTPRLSQPTTSSSSSVHSPISLPTSSAVSSAIPTTPTPMFNHGSYTSHAHMSNYTYVPNLPSAASSDMFNDTNTPTSASTTIPSNESSISHQLNHHQQQYVQHQDQNGSTYTDLSSRNAVVSIGYSNQYPTSSFGVSSTEDEYNANNNKPYRPWGTGPEIAY